MQYDTILLCCNIKGSCLIMLYKMSSVQIALKNVITKTGLNKDSFKEVITTQPEKFLRKCMLAVNNNYSK